MVVTRPRVIIAIVGLWAMFIVLAAVQASDTSRIAAILGGIGFPGLVFLLGYGLGRRDGEGNWPQRQ